MKTILLFGLLIGCGGAEGSPSMPFQGPDAAAPDALPTPEQCTGCFGGRLLNECLPGDQPAACGTGGQACAACDAHHSTCTAHACALNLDSPWTLVADGADIAATQPNGAAWDTDGSGPDAFLTCTLDPRGAPLGTTTIAANSYSPRWNVDLCQVTARQLMSAGFRILAWDSDGGTAFEAIGGVGAWTAAMITAANRQEITFPLYDASARVTQTLLHVELR